MNIKHKIKNFKHPYLLVVVFLLLVAVVANSLVIKYLLHQNDQHGNREFALSIINAVEHLNQPLVKDPSGKNYMPEASLVLPPDDSSVGRIVYSYMAGGDGIEPELSVASLSLIYQAEGPVLNAIENPANVLEGVPKLQACSRGVRITFQPVENNNNEYLPESVKTLANGKTVYLNMEKACGNLSLLNFVKKIDSY